MQTNSIEGIALLPGSLHRDQRGWFLNAYRREDSEHARCWGSRDICQINISQTDKIGSVRGLHLQRSPYTEAKIVRCIRGRIWDVVVDLRPNSKTHGQWYSAELAGKNGDALFIPEGCAHGYQVLESDSEILYIHSCSWVPEAETGVRFDDPELAIQWPLIPQGLSERDLALPLLRSLT